MKLRIGSITFLLFLSSVAFPQATSRYLDKPLPQGWEEDTQIFQQVLPVDDQWWKAFQDPVLDSLISVAVKQNYSVLTAIDRINMAKANLRMERGNFFPTIGLMYAEATWAQSDIIVPVYSSLLAAKFSFWAFTRLRMLPKRSNSQLILSEAS